MHHERAQIPYPDITGLCPAHDIKISDRITGTQKCQISLKLACFLSLPPPPQIFCAAARHIYGHLRSMHCVCFRLHAARCIVLLGGPVCEPIWLLAVPSSVLPGRPLCGLLWLCGSFGRPLRAALRCKLIGCWWFPPQRVTLGGPVCELV